MRFSTIYFSTVIAVLSVNAQSNNGTATTNTAPVVSGTELPSAAQQSATACLLTCASDDNECRTKCQALANSVNPIADCQAACPKGDGSATANESYKQCFQACQTAAAQVPSTTAQETSAPNATSSPTGSNGSGNSGDNSGESNGSGVKASGTSSSPSSTPTNASNDLRVSFSVCGVLGLFALMLAL